MKKIGEIFFPEISLKFPLWRVGCNYQFSMHLTSFVDCLMAGDGFPLEIINQKREWHINLHWNWITFIFPTLPREGRYIKIILKEKER